MQWISRALLFSLVLQFSAVSTFASVPTRTPSSEKDENIESINGPSGRPFGIPGTNVAVETGPEAKKTDLGAIESLFKSRRTKAIDALRSKLTPQSTTEIGALIDLLKIYANPDQIVNARLSKIEKIAKTVGMGSTGMLAPITIYVAHHFHPYATFIFPSVILSILTTKEITNQIRTRREARATDLVEEISQLLIEVHTSDFVKDPNNYQNLKNVLIENNVYLPRNVVRRLLGLFQKPDRSEILKSYPSLQMPESDESWTISRAARERFREKFSNAILSTIAVGPPPANEQPEEAEAKFRAKIYDAVLSAAESESPPTTAHSQIETATEIRIKQELAISGPEKELFEQSTATEDSNQGQNVDITCKKTLD